MTDTTLPEVDTEGRVSGLTEEPRGTLHYQYRAEDCLEASRPLPSRLLLSHSVATGEDRHTSATASALAHALVAFLPLMLGADLLKRMTDSKPTGLWSFLALLSGVMARAYWKDFRAPGWAWVHTQWLDFEERTWHGHKVYTDHSLPDSIEQLSMKALALVCFEEHWDQGHSHAVGLCTVDEVERNVARDPICLHQIYSADMEADAHAFACALALRWGLPCWRHVSALPPVKKRLLHSGLAEADSSVTGFDAAAISQTAKPSAGRKPAGKASARPAAKRRRER